MNTPPFSELGLPDFLLAAIHTLGFEQPSPIQAMSIPPALAGRDLVGLSATGSGKTAAYVLPALTLVDTKSPWPQVLVLCPTRELSVQVCGEVHLLGAKMRGLHATPIYGGAPMDRQLRALREGAHVVVGTPGRLLDHLRRRSLDPSRIRMAILDEADRMLDMGFKEEMDELLAQIPAGRQMLFFSATMNPGVSRLIRSFAKEPEVIEIKQKSRTVSTVDQSYFEVRQRSKVEVLSRILDMNPPRLALVFCNTKRSVDECAEDLINRGYAADRLHGDMSQMMRERTLKRFREGAVELLVATDVAARGLDIDEIDIVFNYDLPTDPEDYLHRIGRTGRAGRSGRAVNFVYGRDIYRLQSIERFIRQTIRREHIPSAEQVEGRRADIIFDALKERLESGKFDAYQESIDRLLEQGHTPTDIAGALVSMLREASGREGSQIEEDRQPVRPTRRSASAPHEPRREMERAPRSRLPRDHGPARQEPGMTRLFISMGKTQGVMAKEIVGMLYRQAELPDACLGKITLFPNHSLVDVPSELVEQVMHRTRSARLCGRPFRIDVDRMPG